MAGGRVTNSIRIEMDPSAGSLVQGFEDWADEVDDWGGTWPYVAKAIRSHNARTFDSEGAATGRRVKWAALSPRYAARKAQKLPGRPILVRTGALRRALVDGGPGSYLRTRRKSFEMGLTGRNRDVASLHMKGTRWMPSRPPIQYDRDPRPSGTLAYVVVQMIQATAVSYRRAALAGEKRSSADVAKLNATLARLAARSTR